MFSFLLAYICLSFNGYHEARSEGVEGLSMVAHVTLVRANHDPAKVCQVVLKPKAFSWANDVTDPTLTPAQRFDAIRAKAPKEPEAWKQSQHIAYRALRGDLNPDLIQTLGQADHYFNPRLANPRWAKKMKFIARVNNHDVYLSNQRWR